MNESTHNRASHSDQSWMPTVAGILDICAGASSIIGAVVLLFLAFASWGLPHNIEEPVPEWPFEMGFGLFFGLAVMMAVLGLVAVIGGLYALQRKRRLWPIFGAVAATLACLPLGVAAIVLTVMSEKEFSQT